MISQDDPAEEILALIRESAAAHLAAKGGLARARRVKTRGLPDAEGWRETAALGWPGMLAGSSESERLGLAAVAALHEELGRGLAPEPLAFAAHLPILAARRCSGPAAAGLIAAIAAGETACPLAWQSRPGALSAEETGLRLEWTAGRALLSGEARFVPHIEGARFMLIAARSAEGVGLYRVPYEAGGLRRSLEQLADGSPSATLLFDGLALSADDVVGAPGEGGRALDAALDETRVILAAELVGLMREVFARTLDYLRTRQQFGRPIGAFQALQHRAVDLYVEIELSAAALGQAVAQIEAAGDAQQRATAASAVKARASQAALLVAREAVQLHGAIAYADEHDIGLFLARALTLAAALGSAAAHRRRYGLLVSRNLAA